MQGEECGIRQMFVCMDTLQGIFFIANVTDPQEMKVRVPEIDILKELNILDV